MEQHEKSTEKRNVTGQKQHTERRRREAQTVAEKKPRMAEYGTHAHAYEAKAIQNQKKAEGQKKGVDFDTEKTLKHSDGRKVRLDNVDYKSGTITDHKQIAHNENLENFVAKTEPQRKRHEEGYEHNREQKKLPEQAKKLREYRYNNLHGSSKDKVGDMPNTKEVTVKRDRKGKETAEAEMLKDGPTMTGVQKIERRKREAYKQSGLYDAERKKRHFDAQRENES